MARSSLRLRFASLIAIGVLISSAQSGLAVDQPADIFKGKATYTDDVFDDMELSAEEADYLFWLGENTDDDVV